MTLSKALKKIAKRKPLGPLWKGPEVDGVTQSMLNDFLSCRERFRIKYIEGLQPPDRFKHQIEYGNMWHLCEETYSNERVGPAWESALKDYTKDLCKQYPDQQEQVVHWYNVCKTQFPYYVEHWKKDKTGKNPLFAEETFSVPYTLPSGRKVVLRGKWDKGFGEGSQGKRSIWLQENKTKGEIDEENLRRQLSFDLQTMFYLTALSIVAPVKFKKLKAQVRGVLYNVVRRPLSGGKGTIRRHKPTKTNPKGESQQAFYARLGQYIADDPGYFFMQWKVHVSQQDIANFRRKFLNPILEQLCDWWDWVIYAEDNCRKPIDFDNRRIPSGVNRIHWQTPYGIWNPLARGAPTDLDNYIATGSTVGLERKDKLFKELD